MGRNKGKGCSICGEPVYAKNLCKKHYQQRNRQRQTVKVPRIISRIRRRRIIFQQNPKMIPKRREIIFQSN